MRCQVLAVSFMLCVSLSGCASVPVASHSGGISMLRDALNIPLAELETKATSGDARAQFSTSLVYQFGLKGTPADPLKATTYRRQALSAKGYTPITQYIAGLNGNPGRTAIINVPRYEVTAGEARAAYVCAQAVAGRVAPVVGAAACGTTEVYAEFVSEWSGEKSRWPVV
ncbi:hypothetical protein [Asticcacaulis excentricus]|uniref:Lipoprotein n=1 Tax=Asticcacaulis excentricus (strain ATCC 15261 / DSM 4724 / KCTC 12464 / NCIMB 9791 / VKM B-1370 / CB 48) TaxID=573065 RepID=E8RKY8_ASTEC|nr:hypothetical protein [Asticcacaulis excentricus]ADU12548.1 hypothetical protein Astex_0866 [Asticcacaulis excentricus CB 48]